MRRVLAACALLLAALPARGDVAMTQQEQTRTLTSIDALPSVTGFELASLQGLAQDASDPWIAIRATRALGEYCSPVLLQSCTGPVHDVLLQIIERYQLATTGVAVLRLRAAVEALGAARGVESDEDIAALTALLDSPSRDVRATAVRALGTSCSRDVKDTLTKRTESSKQVQVEIIAAVQALVQCPNLR